MYGSVANMHSVRVFPYRTPSSCQAVEWLDWKAFLGEFVQNLSMLSGAHLPVLVPVTTNHIHDPDSVNFVHYIIRLSVWFEQ